MIRESGSGQSRPSDAGDTSIHVRSSTNTYRKFNASVAVAKCQSRRNAPQQNDVVVVMPYSITSSTWTGIRHRGTGFMEYRQRIGLTPP